ncbi:hypothetical protein QE381_000016 [Microbacterium sp. SORGH_AS 888]|nr:hypothetical protein [Microbacterium sp. SORGH_AS_0888]
MEQVRPVPVHLYPGHRLGLAVRIPTDVMTTIDDRHLPTGLGRTLRDRETEKTGADYQQIHREHLSRDGRSDRSPPQA